LGSSKDTDVLIFEEVDDTFSCSVSKSLSDKYIYISSWHTDRSEYRVVEADHPDGEFKVFLPREGKHEYSLKDGVDRFYIVTNDNDNKNFKLVEAPLTIPTNKNEWKVIPFFTFSFLFFFCFFFVFCFFCT
jgi:oligopeptidase B